MTTAQCSRNTRFVVALAVGAATVLALSGVCEALPTSGPPDPPCDEAEPPVLYNPDCLFEPQDANPPWCDTECGPTVGDFGTIIGVRGDLFLEIDDDSTQLRGYYCRTGLFDPDCNGTQEAVFEIAGRGIIADTDVHQIDIYLRVGLRDGNPVNPLLNGKDITIAIATTGVGFAHSTQNGQDWIPGGVKFTDDIFQTNQYHVYRVEKHVISDTETELRLFVDESATPDVTLDYAALDNFTENRALMVTSTPGTSTFLVDFYRYRIGTTTLRTGPNCAADIDNDGSVGVSDFLILLGEWGPCADPNDCRSDIDDTCDSDGVVGTADFLFLLASWGDCP
ncbi:MAG: hypothetical protein IH983_07100 [Planctomycetes bacterium]|nr:hypothetical protein [Planctomycetota bacterium]